MGGRGAGEKAGRRYVPALVMWLVFESIAVGLWLALDNVFYLFNFSYIGTAIAVGLVLYGRGKRYARNVVQFAVGLYMLGYLGVLCRENMQIEGFWYYLFLGVFEAAVIHYVVAKICGPVLFGRGWCGYACWTAMVLDVLPFKEPAGLRKRWGAVRYVVFAASLAFVGLLFVLEVPARENIIWWSFVVGNALYYAAGITLAFVCKDNRAFCKYVCPVTVFLKPASYFSILRVKVDEAKCVSCGACTKACPMNVEVPSNSRRKHNATECILCLKCVEACPKKALKL